MKPRISPAWLRVIVFCIFFFLVLLLAVSLLAVFHQLPSPAKQGVPYLLVIITAVLSTAVVWLFCRFIDRREFSSLGFSIDKNGANAGTGFFLGIFLLCAGTCILFFSKNLVWTDINFNGNDLFISFGLMLIIAFYEEIVFRGYILNNLLASLNKWVALLISAFVFALAHLANPEFSVVAAVNIFLAGVLLGLNYAYTRNLWFGILLHFSWNFFQGPVLGYDVSGMQLPALLQHEVTGSSLLTGGSFGFEGSLVATGLLVLASGALIWVYEKKYTSWPSEDIVTA